MVRILVLIEDHNEMTQISTLLKKVGCDVDSANNEIGLKEKILSLKPHLLLVSGLGKKINPASIAKKMKEIVGFDTKIILILAPGVKISLNDLATNKFDAFLESPYDPMRLINLISKLSNGRANDLAVKFQQLAADGALGKTADLDANDKRLIKGNFVPPTSVSYSPPSPKELKDRIEKYSQIVKDVSVSKTSTISKLAAKAAVKALQKNWDKKMLEELDEEKRKVANLLFKK